MYFEALGSLTSVVVLFFIGLGPALWLVSPQEKRFAYAAAIAPVLGFSFIGLFAFPLLRFVGPARVWTWPFTLFLLALSSACVALDWCRHRQDYRLFAGWRSLLGSATLILLSGLLLAAPLFSKGINYAVFRGNPSDAFTYMSVAETFRVGDWPIIEAGADMTNLEGVARLAEVSPTALYSARMILKPIRVTTQVVFAWATQLLGIPIQQFFYAFNLISFIIAMSLALALAAQMGLPKKVGWLAAWVMVFGFWARFLLEIDAAARINLLPMFLFFAFAWIQFEKTPLRALSRQRVLLALASAALAAFYVQAVPFAVLAFMLYYALGLFQRVISFKALLYHAVTLALALSFIILATQVDFALKTLFWQTPVVVGDTSLLTDLDALRYLYHDGPAALWGLPFSLLHEVLAFGPALAWRAVGFLLGTVLSLFFLVLSWRSVRNARRIDQRIYLTLLVAGAIVSAVMFAAGTNWASGRAFTYVYPFLVFGLLALWKEDWPLPLAWRSAARVFVAAWFVVQIGFGAYLPYAHLTQLKPFRDANTNKPEDYDVYALTHKLDEVSPQRLVVSTPREEDLWMFPYYLMFVFDDYPAYFLSGMVFDNNTNYQNFWPGELDAAPDYAVVRGDFDFVAQQGLGELVASTKDLRLYRVTSPDVEVFHRQQKILQAAEKDKLLFPGLVSP
ncbi:MAG: hypothetical protein GXP38_04710 [Chloroflexi bacterium]|nr:hypothetical protein [Chloroflexota bacterium]